MAHTHHCKVCGTLVSSCSDERCVGGDEHYCSLHHPDPEYHLEDKPTVRMTVAIAKDDESES